MAASRSSTRQWARAGYVVLHAVSGVYAGACVCIAVVDLPVVHALSEGDEALVAPALALSAMGRLMAPQLLLMLLLTALLTWRARGRAARGWVPLALLGAIVAITLVVHIPINQRIISGHLTPSQVPALLERWADFHWLRTVLSLALPYSVVRFLRKASMASAHVTQARVASAG
jgi:hypothetical protein